MKNIFKGKVKAKKLLRELEKQVDKDLFTDKNKAEKLFGKDVIKEIVENYSQTFTDLGNYDKKNRTAETGANRNSDEGKLDYEAFNSPIVDWYYAQYMHSHRLLEDGTFRDGDNWQKGFPDDWYHKSLARHYKDYHLTTRGIKVLEKGKEMKLEDILCGIIFNAKGHLHKLLKDKKEVERDFEK